MPPLIICNLKVCLCCLVNVSETSSNNSNARKRTGLRQSVLLMSRACSLRCNLMPAPLHSSCWLLSRKLHSLLWAHQCMQGFGHQGPHNCLEHQCCAVSSRVRLFLQGWSWRGRYKTADGFKTNKHTQTLQKTDGRAQAGWAFLGWRGAV